jgi:ABC-type ATPase involved in cell division
MREWYLTYIAMTLQTVLRTSKRSLNELAISRILFKMDSQTFSFTILLTGAPGTGKSTFLQALEADKDTTKAFDGIR